MLNIKMLKSRSRLNNPVIILEIVFSNVFIMGLGGDDREGKGSSSYGRAG